MNQELDPSLQKLLEYAKDKPVVSWDEITAILGTDFVKDEKKTNEIYEFLQSNNVQIMEEDSLDEDEDEDSEDDEDLESDEDADVADEDGGRLVNNDKDSNVDDPIRLYLKEIGKEKLLTAEEEVKYSKEMEDGENIIKGVIKDSGMMIPEFYAVAQKAFTRIDPHEPGKARKEINEEMAEKRRLKSCYSEWIKPILPEMKQYMAIKKQLFDSEQSSDIFDNPQLVELREKISPELKKIEIQSEEIEKFSEKFVDAVSKIDEYRHNQEKKMKELRINSTMELRTLGRKLAIHSESAKLEKELGLSSDEIRNVYTQIQKIDRKLRRMEYDFENNVEDILTKAREIDRGRRMMEKAKNKLINANLRLVVSIAKK